MSKRTPMQVSIEKLLKAHKLLDAFQNSGEFHARLEMPHYNPLVIERHGDQIAIGHIFTQNGDVMYDPEIVFHYDTWEPLEITQSPVGVYRRKFIQRNGKTYVDTRFRASVMPLARLWARNLRCQGWKNAQASSLTHSI